MKTCPHCRKRIDAKAIKCPYCGSSFDGHEIEVGRREHSRERWGTFWLVILAIAALFWWLTRDETIDRLAEYSASEAVAEDLQQK
ncbi:hypothetical protein [Novosphingobium sp. HII-3]|uniref:hypothetical protein n=1 Tax=Novosphingobium sp. HII-3 TaxID=2075565 RepID=UPI0011AED64B|nr:hypothetical protein [Novosphingobium sp. HII-3]